MATNVCRRVSVGEMVGDDCRCVEHLLGQPLQEDQQVCILAFKPGVVQDDDTRRRALASMQRTFAAAEQHARNHGVTEAQIDAAVDEATDKVRYGKP